MTKILLFIFTMAITSTVWADIYDVPRVNIIEHKKYYLHDELAIQLSYLPLDPYVKYFSAGLAYTHFFSEFTGWEVINGQYAMNFPAGLQNNLLSDFSTGCKDPTKCVVASDFPTLTYFATSNIVFTPLYTKNLFFNSSLVYSQVSFVAGGGIAGFTDAMKSCIDLGVVLRYFLSPSSSLKFDFRDYVFLNQDQKNNLTITAAYTFNLGKTENQKNVEFEK